MYHTYICIISIISVCWPVEVSMETDPVFRVVNGTNAILGQLPYQISLRSPSRNARRGAKLYHSFCGGALLGEKKILTAAHCLCDEKRGIGRLCGAAFEKKSISDMYAVAATLLSQQSYPKATETDRTAEQWRELQDTIIPYGFSFPKRDIAIAITKVPFEFNGNVGSLPYAIKTMDYGYMKCVASGYGRISHNTRSSTLQWANLDLISTRACSRLHKKQMKLFICTQSRFTDVLQGDSGGPLVCKNTGDPAEKDTKGVIVGVVSGSRKRSGTFFTRVSSYKKFIESKAITTTTDGLCASIVLTTLLARS